MKTELFKDAEGGETLLFHCPGCGCLHGPIVKAPAGTRPVWQWNGDRDRPTLSPSIRVQGTVPLTEDEYQRVMRGEKVEPKPLLCHTFVRDGQIEFLSDCTHALAGKSVPIPDLDD